MNDFPEFDVFQDYRGREVRFIYNLLDAGHLFSLRAREDTKNDHARQFTAYDSKSPVNALIKMRNKIREELNKRYFTEERDTPFKEMNFDYFRGNITCDSENSEACLVIDGKKMSMRDLYDMIAQKIQLAIEKELGITVSIGVSLSKVLAKIGSKHKKPHGITIIPGRDIHLYLENLPVEKVWGIGANTAAYLKKHRITTALQFAGKDEQFIKKYLSRPYQEIWHELNGRSVYPVITESKNSYQSISKAKTFTPPSTDETFIFAQLSKNLENACIKARRYILAATRLIVFLRGQDFRSFGVEIRLRLPSAYPYCLMGPLKEGFTKVYRPNIPYRQTGVVLAGLVPDDGSRYTLFDDMTKIEKMAKIYEAVDRLSGKYGKHTVQHGSSLPTKQQAQHEGDRGDVPLRHTELFKGENKRQRLGLPVLDIKV